MLICLQIPFADSRSFLQEETNRLLVPAWPWPRTARAFIRSFGAIHDRRKGGVPEWNAENTYCSAARGIRLPSRISYALIGAPPAVFQPHCLFRRFFFDGLAVARFELGFELEASQTIESLSDEQFLACVNDFLATKVRVTEGKQTLAECQLQEVGSRFATHYLRATTTQKRENQLSTEPWWFVDAAPTLVLESKYHPPSFAKRVLIDTVPCASLHHFWLERRGQRIGIWYIQRLEEREESPRLRNLRINLLRLHAEYQVLMVVLRQVASKKIGVIPKTQATEDLQHYLNCSTGLLSRNQNYGLTQWPILESLQRIQDYVDPGMRATLCAELERIRPQVLRKTSEFINRGGSADTLQIVSAQGNVIIQHLQVKGGIIMKNFPVNIGGDVKNVGNFVVAGAIQESLNGISNTVSSSAVSDKLVELAKAVVEIANKMNAEEAEILARNYKTFAAEATAAKPQKKVLEVTAEGIMDAAKATIGLGVGATQLVKEIISLVTSFSSG